MQCHDVHRYFYMFLDSELDARTNADIYAHVEQCTECRKRFEFFGQVRSNLRTWGNNHKAPPNLHQRISMELQKRDSRWRLQWSIVATLAAALVLWVVWVGSPLMHRAPAASSLSALLPRLLEVHEHYAAQLAELGVRSDDFWVVDEWLNVRLNFPVVVPRASLAGYYLDGASIFKLGEEFAALAEYHEKDEQLGYIVFKDTGFELDLPARQRVDPLVVRHGAYQDYHIASWTSGGNVHVLLSKQGERELLEYAKICVALTQPGAVTKMPSKP